MAPVKVASVQASSVSYDLASSLSKLAQLTAEAAQAGARFVVFPEAFLSAYPRHLAFAIGARTEENREWYKKYVESAIKLPRNAVGRLKAVESDAQGDEGCEAYEKLGKIAQENQYLSVGIIERTLVGSTLYCSNILISPQGILLSLHRKLQPTACERVVWSQGHAWNSEQDSTNLAVVDTEIGKIGGLICWENFMPLPRYALYQQGVEIYTAPTADARPTWAPSMQHIAQEGRCFVISANQYHKPTDFPDAYPPRSTSITDLSKAETWSRGGSVIVDPLGQILAGPLWDTEGILYAEIDLDTLHGAKLDFDPIGHYAREDLFEFSVTGDRSRRAK